MRTGGDTDVCLMARHNWAIISWDICSVLFYITGMWQRHTFIRVSHLWFTMSSMKFYGQDVLLNFICADQLVHCLYAAWCYVILNTVSKIFPPVYQNCIYKYVSLLTIWIVHTALNKLDLLTCKYIHADALSKWDGQEEKQQQQQKNNDCILIYPWFSSLFARSVFHHVWFWWCTGPLPYITLPLSYSMICRMAHICFDLSAVICTAHLL